MDEIIHTRMRGDPHAYLAVHCDLDSDETLFARLEAIARFERARRVMLDVHDAPFQVVNLMRALALDAARTRVFEGASAWFDRIAFVVGDAHHIERINILALSERLGVRAYATQREAEQWLTRTGDITGVTRAPRSDSPAPSAALAVEPQKP